MSKLSFTITRSGNAPAPRPAPKPDFKTFLATIRGSAK